ncbi:MAG: prolyl oligopeptidase family serine peptidase [Capsulimonas sp.]|uniref:carboxylesterase family protein n=1 Tax=Capsulimonas sp. TaxID=2494211 RepID=UPI0032655391
MPEAFSPRTANAQIGSPAPFDDHMRQPWVPESSPPFLRSWLICGRFSNPPKSTDQDTLAALRTGVDTNYLKNYPDEGAAHPADKTEEPLPGGGKAVWTPYTSPTDVVDFTQLYTDGQTNNYVAYAYATITSQKPDDMMMTVGSDDAVRVWLNGKLVHTNVATRGVSPDNDIVSVRLNQGVNTVLVKVVNGGGGWGFALRLAHASDLGNSFFRPWVAPETPDHKIVVTTAPGRNDAVPVDVTILAAGGKIVSKQRSTLGVPVTFDAGAWPDGAYEARCIPTFADGERSVVSLGFYHGDALAAARRLVTTAPSNSQTESELTHAMLADLVRSKIGDPAADRPLTNEEVGSIVSPLMEWEEIQSKSQIRPDGFVRFAYRDPIDDSPQFCRVYLPPDYTPDKKWPMVVILHGANFDNPSYVGWAGMWGIDARHNDRADLYHVIEIEPMGRYNSFYRGLGEQDILRCIQMAKDRFSVDDDRVYLGGISMGGAGTWQIGSRHPELFAAISPNLGVFDYHVNTQASTVAKLSPRDLFFWEAQSTLAPVESLLTTPVFVNHGDADPVIDVNQSRYAVRMLQRWGYDVRYWEHPGGGHGDFNSDSEVFPWFLRHTRVSNPSKVQVRAADVKTASAHWVRILQCTEPYRMMTAEAEVIGPNRIKLSTANSLAVALSPKAPLIDPSKPISVTWNGVDEPPAKLANGALTFYAAGYHPATGDKITTIAGPLNDITNTPFAIVVGSQSSDPAVNAFCRQSADDFVARWRKAQHCAPRVFLDTQITDGDITRYSLYLIGGANANAVTARLAKQLPLQIDKSTITIAGRAFEAPDAAYQAIFPNPLNPERYVRVCGATSAGAMTKLWSIPEDAYDFGIVDARTGEPIAYGVFDAHWRCTDAGTLLDKDAIRTNPQGPRAP